MCAWDVGNFNSDDAADFINEVINRGGLKRVEAALDEALNHDYIEDDTGARTIAAGEVVAMLRGQPAVDIPASLADWHQSHQLSADNALTAKTILAVEKAWADDGKSGWREFWEDSPNFQAVQVNIMELLSRLRS